ncbi:hypothetical protein [Eubacterium aggregans]|uniref:hypothetical protein n=1 Tax=Eubacterium aggregans TaxID=81409 RepID=UPI003F3A4AFC
MKEFARLLVRIFGEGAVYRIGGDEFAVILTDSDEARGGCAGSALKMEWSLRTWARRSHWVPPLDMPFTIKTA